MPTDQRFTLTLLDGARWNGGPVIGERPQALLAALAGTGRTVGVDRLVDLVWSEDVPANPAKALQVLVSRTRTACAPEAVVRDGDGYRLGIPPEAVDAVALLDLVAAAEDRFEQDPATAEVLAGQAIGIGRITLDSDPGPLGELRREAAGGQGRARLLQARARARSGDHAAALPVLERTWQDRPGDEALLADLLRSEAAVRGSAAALTRYEDYREGLRDRLGSDPGDVLRRLHSELLALDSPVRDGVQYDANALLGRDDDVRRLHAMLTGSRVVSILGPGGLGKTRLAHVIGRQSTAPVVHFVELVGVTVADDLVGEVGSALGVRDSVSGRRALTPEQRADVRARIAQHLDGSPSLLILDNCEHVVEAVADLVAFLVATTRELTVLTTTRAPLAISAERVYPLGELNTADGVELFRQRAVAARPEVQIADHEVAGIVERLDGLPLAIELAAAKVRVMSVSDIGRRLENRFALLRGGDRSAPDRHQTLIAVIDWSWNLLNDDERRAMRWLSVFHDGFTLDAAEAVLGPEALQAVANLSDQSLLTVRETSGGIRYRMLETVREFGRMQLVDAGEDADAHVAQCRWAVGYANRWTADLMSPNQFAAVDAFRDEENNLADVLRQFLAGSDPEGMVQVLAGIGSFWMILGDHARVFVLTEAVSEVVDGWTPPPFCIDQARIAIVMVVNNSMIGNTAHAEVLRAKLRELGPGDGDRRIAAMVTIMMDFDPSDVAGFTARLAELAENPDRDIAGLALQWSSHALENTGDPAGALDAAERAITLADPENGAWSLAILRTQVAQLAMQLGRREEAVVSADAALPVLQRLGARDDTLQLQALLGLSAIAVGDLDAATVEIERLDWIEDAEGVFGGRLVVDLSRAELLLAAGDAEGGLARYREAVDRVRALEFPGVPSTGLEPWVLFAESTALTAYAYYGGADSGYPDALYDTNRRQLGLVLDPDYQYLDYPVCGLSLFALGAWGVLRDRLPIADGVRLLVLADRFAYNRSIPTMAWDRIAARVEALSPGLLAEIDAEYGERRGPDLLDEAKAFVEKIGA